jgi:hypothetical protein
MPALINMHASTYDMGFDAPLEMTFPVPGSDK